jgi:hypothetical protein
MVFFALLVAVFMVASNVAFGIARRNYAGQERGTRNQAAGGGYLKGD